MTPAEFEEGLALTAFGLVTAFVALGLLYLVINLIHRLATLRKPAATAETASEEGGSDIEQEKAVAAATAVAIALQEEEMSGFDATPLAGDRWRASERQQLMDSRQLRRGWRR